MNESPTELTPSSIGEKVRSQPRIFQHLMFLHLLGKSLDRWLNDHKEITGIVVDTYSIDSRLTEVQFHDMERLLQNAQSELAQQLKLPHSITIEITLSDTEARDAIANGAYDFLDEHYSGLQSFLYGFAAIARDLKLNFSERYEDTFHEAAIITDANAPTVRKLFWIITAGIANEETKR